MNRMSKGLIVATLSLSFITPSFGATEIDEQDFGPTYDSMVADAVAGKPLGLLAVAGGAATWLVSLPFTIFTGDVVKARHKLVDEPWAAMNRCLGCTPAEDAYYKAQQPNTNKTVHVVVDGPADISINTQQQVVVATP